jgi:glycerol-3-phosphate acyltransferase PlsY
MILVFMIGAYLLGAVPTGYIVTKFLKGVDIRACGSGNPGATNVFRTAGTTAGITTFAIDVLKGFLPVFIAVKYFGDTQAYFWILTGICAIAGHMWTVFLGFRGGKGVATAAGVFAALLPVGTLCAFALFAAIVFVTKYVSLGSIIAAVFLSSYAWYSDAPSAISSFVTITALAIVLKHKKNIERLAAGTENKFGAKNNE